MKITICNAVKATPIPTNQYVVELTCMSGDGDVYDNNRFRFKEDELIKAQEFVALAEAIKDAQCNGECRTVDDLKQNLLPEFEGKFTSDNLHNMCGNDVTTQIYLAAIDSVTVYYYDKHGIMHNCTHG